MPKQRVFSGIQPSGNLHIGNYLGAIRQFVDLQKTHEAIYCIVDEHAITVPQNPKELYKNTLDAATMYLAAGLDPKKSIIFVQSHVPAHTELGWILNTITPLGELERMTQFKEKAKKGKKKTGILAGLFNYPTLMAADILLYKPNLVPVGEDQVQHVEFTRMIASKFNRSYGNTFIIPQPLIQKEVARIMGLDDPTKKMSKSAPSPNNYIALLDSPKEIRRKIKIAVTDSGKEVRFDKVKKPAISNLMTIYSAFSNLSISGVEKRYHKKGYKEFKEELGELLVEKLEPLQKKYYDLSRKKKQVLKILRDGAGRAQPIAQKTLKEAKTKIGLVELK